MAFAAKRTSPTVRIASTAGTLGKERFIVRFSGQGGYLLDQNCADLFRSTAAGERESKPESDEQHAGHFVQYGCRSPRQAECHERDVEREPGGEK